jgi:hypothetical protein
MGKKDEPAAMQVEPSQSVDTGAGAPQALPDTPKRRLRKRDVLFALATGLGGLLVALALGFVLLIGRDLRVPDWLEADIKAHIKQAMPDLDVRIGQIAFRIERSDLSPRVFFQNVVVRDETELPFMSLGELSVRASFPAAMQGDFLPKRITLSGALMKLRRGRDGQFDLTLGSAVQASGQGADFAALIERIDGVLMIPEMRYLTEVKASSLTLLYEDARSGRAWTVDGGRMALNRRDAALALRADFALLGGQDYATTLALSYESPIGSAAAKVGLELADAPAEDIATQSPAMSWMRGLRAPISGALRGSVDADGELGPLSATLQIGAGAVHPEDEARPIPFEAAQAYLTYDPVKRSLEFTEISVQSAWGAVRAEGRARVHYGAGDWPDTLVAQLRFTDILANPEGVYPAPVTLEQADLDMRLTLDPFRVEIGSLALQDEGEVITLSGGADIGAGGWRVNVDVSAPQLSTDRVLELWPAGVRPPTRKWVANNVLGGALTDLRLAYRDGESVASRLHLDFSFSEARFKFMRALPPIEAARGYIQIAQTRLLAMLETGYVTAPQGGRLDASGTYFTIPDLSLIAAPAEVHLEARGPITAASALLDLPPFEFLSKAGLPKEIAIGRAEVSGDIGFALSNLLKPADVDFAFAGDLSDVRADNLVPGRLLTASKLQFSADRSQVSLSGAALLDTMPVKGKWQMPVGQPGASSQVTAALDLSQTFLDTFSIDLPPGSVSGSAPAQITLDIGKGAAPAFDLTSDLAGLGMNLSAFGWRKAAGRSGKLRASGTLGTTDGAPPVVDDLRLEAPGLTLRGSVAIAKSGALERADFTTLKVGDWLSTSAALIGRGRNVAPALQLRGGSVDMRKLPDLSGGAGNIGSGLAAPIPLDLALDSLRVSKDITLQNFRGEFTSGGGLLGGFTGVLGGAVQIRGETLRDRGRTSVRIQSANAGATIAAAGLIKGAQGGNLNLVLRPRGGAGSYDGTLSITDMRLNNVPPPLALLSAASGIGLLEQMDGAGLNFSNVDAAFRLTPQTITIKEASAVGPSIGLSVDGFYDVASKQMDMQGVVSPFFAINGIGSIFTRRGEGLIGFNYTLRGPAAKPDVSVNPLSLFTPGMFREIFRRPPPT